MLPFSQTEDSIWDTFSSPIPTVVGGRGLLHSLGHLPGLSWSRASTGVFSLGSRQGLTVLLALQDRVVRAAGPGVAVQEPAGRGAHLADRQRPGRQTSAGHSQPGQGGQCKYLSLRSALTAADQGGRGLLQEIYCTHDLKENR